MKQIFVLPLVTLTLASPLAAQDEPSLMEQGAQMFFDGLMQEMSPAFEDLSKLVEEAGPALNDFVSEMGPKLRTVLEEVEDWSVYEAPEIQPNGDIIIRRKPDAPDSDTDTAPVQGPPMPQIDL